MIDLDALEALERHMNPGPWKWESRNEGLDFGYVGARGDPTVLFGERYEGAVSFDNTEAAALVAARNALPELIRLARIGQKVEAPASQPEGVVVPREPTEKMLMAACRVLDPTGETMWPAIKDAARRYYTAMIAVAKEERK